jgi:hypothetical protein
MHMAEPLLLEPSPSEVEFATEKMKRYKSLGTDQIPEELIQARGNTLRYDIHRFNTYHCYQLHTKFYTTISS